MLSRQGQRAAAALRHQQGVPRDVPLCAFDLAENVGVEVWFRPETSLEGMYSKEQGVILVSAFRPRGRQAFTCAHELAHHLFGHGSTVDPYLPEGNCPVAASSQEKLANAFAASLLMPISGVRRAFADRNWGIDRCTPCQVLIVAGCLGVGYQTLIEQMRWAHHLISREQYRDLLSTSPQRLRQELLPNQHTQDLVFVDRAWVGHAVDLSVGDVCLLPKGVRHEGKSLARLGDEQFGWSFTAFCAGITRVELPDEQWAAFVRVSRKNFVGRSIFRHLEDPDDMP